MRLLVVVLVAFSLFAACESERATDPVSQRMYSWGDSWLGTEEKKEETKPKGNKEEEPRRTDNKGEERTEQQTCEKTDKPPTSKSWTERLGDYVGGGLQSFTNAVFRKVVGSDMGIAFILYTILVGVVPWLTYVCMWCLERSDRRKDREIRHREIDQQEKDRELRRTEVNLFKEALRRLKIVGEEEQKSTSSGSALELTAS